MSFQFTRPPLPGPIPVLIPQMVGQQPGDTFRFVDPGRIGITSIDSLSNDPENPPVVRKFGTGEFYDTAGYNKTARYRLKGKQRNQAANNARGTPNLGAHDLTLGIVNVESNLPPRRTMTLAVLQAYATAYQVASPQLHSFYSHRFNLWRFFNYRGRQQAHNEMARILTWGSTKFATVAGLLRQERNGFRAQRFFCLILGFQKPLFHQSQIHQMDAGSLFLATVSFHQQQKEGSQRQQ